jgi:hypothetical protein
MCEILLIVLQIHVDCTFLIFPRLVRALDLLTGHAWSIVERLMSLSKVPESVSLRPADDLPFFLGRITKEPVAAQQPKSQL